MRASILIADDDPTLRRVLADRLTHWEHAVTEVADGRAALDATERREFDVIFLDLSMPEMSGLDVLRELRDRGSKADVVVLTAHGSVESAVEAIRLGAADFLLKPADFELLRAVLDRLLERRSLRSANRALSERVDGTGSLVALETGPMRDLLDTAVRAAASNTTVLLTGESGAGKQVVAEFIHRKSRRAGGPFTYVNMVALSDELVESTLFGHEKGAFTGALSRKEGKLEAAAGGTAFLDEIGDISPRVQTKLLHFLETNEFERVGGTRPLTVDARIVAATNRDLPAAIRAGTFREDLYFRLNVITLHVPPLRERAEEIPLLAQAFLDRYGAEVGRTGLRLAPKTAEILRNYEWPGNVRQLRNCMERLAVLARTDTLTPDLLPPEILTPPSEGSGDTERLPLKEAEARFRKTHIARALARNGGNQTRAAEELGLQRTFLNRLIKELGL
jgi:two-component system, NtrC family, response regulator AtoC